MLLGLTYLAQGSTAMIADAKAELQQALDLDAELLWARFYLARLYFDQGSGLLVRMVRYSDSPLGFNPVRIDYADYRPVDGVQVPYRSTVSRPAGQFTIQDTDVKQNIPVAQERFVRPTDPEQANTTNTK